MDQVNNRSSAQRRKDGTFAAGGSGNPAGRPKGSRNRVTQRALDLLDGATDAVVSKLVAMAKRGDPVALRLCVDRMVPRDRVRSITIADMPALVRASDIAAAASTVIALTAAGELTLGEAREFLGLLNTQRSILETEDLAFRIEALEAGPGGAR